MVKTMLLLVGLAYCVFSHANSTLMQDFQRHKNRYPSVPQIEFPHFNNKNTCSDLELFLEECTLKNGHRQKRITTTKLAIEKNHD